MCINFVHTYIYLLPDIGEVFSIHKHSSWKLQHKLYETDMMDMIVALVVEVLHCNKQTLSIYPVCNGMGCWLQQLKYTKVQVAKL